MKTATSTTRTVQSYDNLGRVKDLWQCTPANCGSGWFQMTYNYNELSAVTSQTNPMGFTLTQTWNSAAVMTALTSSWSDAQHPATLATLNTYNPAGAMTQMTLGNSLIETRAFNSRGQPTEMRTYSTASCTPMPSCQDKLKLNYSFVDTQGKNNGNVMAWIGISKPDAQSQKLDFNRSYTYDQLNRIKTLFSPGETCLGLEWEYDIWGNRLNQNNGGGTCGVHHPTVNTQNRLTGTGIQYDAAGNMSAEPGKTYQYDAENRMTSIGNGCPNTLCYTYDANGKRVRKVTGGVTTDYVYDAGGTLVAERQGSTWTKGYVQFNGQLLAQYNGVISSGGATTYFAHKDHLGSTRILTTYNGSPHQTFDYLPFGESISPPTPSQSSATTSNQFTGKERDSESGLDNFGARYNSSNLGRFTSPDPKIPSLRHLLNPQKWNKYAYTINNPLRYVDPDGMEEVEVQVRTFIPQKSVSVLGSRFAGDNRTFSTARNASSRTSITVRIETDASKRANPIISVTSTIGQTAKLDANGNVIQTATANTGVPTVAGTRDANGNVVLNFQQDTKNPLTPQALTPGISTDLTVTVSQNASSVTAVGTTSGFPAIELNVTPEGRSTTNIPLTDPGPNASALNLFNTNTLLVSKPLPPPPPPCTTDKDKPCTNK